MHLYVNGVYWGLYNPSERPDAAFAADYIGGSKEDWDVLNQDGVTDGNGTAWNTMLSLADAVANAPTEADRTAAYQRIQGNNPDGSDNPAYPAYLDVDSLIDYMLLNIFTGNADWPHRNWYAGRLRADDGVGTDATGFKFFTWDAESALDLWADVNTNRTGVNVGPAQPYDRLRASADFRARFAERVQTHLFGNGALSTAANKARMQAVTDQIDRAIVAESARWGDQHRDPPYTRADWAADLDSLVRAGGYFDRRWPIVLSQLRAAGLYGAVDAPAFSPGGGQVQPGTQLNLSGATGTIYYTLDGSDPRLPGGGVNPSAASLVVGGGSIVARGSVWKYLDNGSDQATAWRATDFVDSGWASGNAQLGYGDGDEAKVVSYGPDSANKYITTYFRKSFEVTSPSQYQSLRLRVLRDDGAVVNLNGQEVARGNMPAGAVNYRTLASGVVEDTLDEFTLDPSKLRTGTNVFAVEIHQAGGNSSDISFDLELYAPAPPVSITLPGGTTHVRARSRDAAGNWSALSDAVFHTDPAASAANVAVTEINYNPRPPEPALGEPAAADPGDFEFIELMNTSPQRVVLAGAEFRLGVKFEFPADAYLDPGERAVVVKNVAAFRARYGSGPRVLGTFTGSLANDGEMTILQDARGAMVSSLHYNGPGDWPDRADGRGATLELIDPSRDAANPDNWRSGSEYGGTPGAAGSGPLPGVVVNEVLTNTDAPALDAVELFNPTVSPVDLGGWFLSDSSADFRKYLIPDGTVIAPGGYLLFNETTLGFALDGEGDDVWLMAADPATGRLTRFADHVEFGPAPAGDSWGRWPDGNPDAGFYLMAPRTLGTANTGVHVGPVVINEVMYAPRDGGQEFVELANVSNLAVSVAGWRFTAGIDYEFPAGTTIPANGYLLLVGGDPAEFRAANGVPDAVPVLGPFTAEGFLNVLDNAGEQLTFSRPGVAPAGGDVPWYEVDRVFYRVDPPWPTGAHTGGASLARRFIRAWGGAAAGWADEVVGGSPGRANFGGAPAAAVLGRHVFYNRSAADARSVAAGYLDDYALAADKQALLPGQAASLANVTSYICGINGIMVDVAGFPGAAALTAADLQFSVGNGSAWSAAPTPLSVTVRGGAGDAGSDRVTVVFPDGAIRNTWLRVTVLADTRTGLAAPDVFYFGNLVGDTGDAAGAAKVDADDVLRARRSLSRSGAESLRVYDFNRDGLLNALDLAAVRRNLGAALSSFTAPAAPAPAAARQPLFSDSPVRSRTAPRRSLWETTFSQ
jgi:hypothetical protein